MKSKVWLFAVMLLCPAEVLAGPDVSTQADWSLTRVFADEAAISAESSAIRAELPKFTSWRGRLGDAAGARAALDARSSLRARAARISNYASMRLARDATDSTGNAMAAKAGTLTADLNAATSFIEPELVGLGVTKLTALAADPRLVQHRFTLELLAIRAAHVLPADQEALVASAAPLQNAPAVIRDIFTNGELPWSSIDVHGAPRRLSPQGFGKSLQDPDRAVRRTAWETFSKTRVAYQQTEAALLAAYLAGEGWEAKLRHWSSQTEFVTAGDPMPTGAFAALSEEAAAASNGPMARYLALKARQLGLPALASYDLAAPFVADTRQFTIEQAKQMTLDAVAPLGADYRDRLARGFADNLMDWRPQPTKGPGANTFYVAPEIPGYVELSFTGDYASVSALAHEWGHWMHWEYSRASGRPYETLAPPVTVGDVPSFLNELLLADRQITLAKTREARIIALTSAIEALRGAYYNVLVQANFDLAVRAASDRGDPLDADQLSGLYCAARKRFSPANIAWDDRDCLGWVTDPNVFYDLYFYRYLLATSAAAWFAERIEQHDRTSLEEFKALLAAGGSANAATLLRQAGFDPADPSFYRAMTRRLDRLVEMLEHEIDAEHR